MVLGLCPYYTLRCNLPFVNFNHDKLTGALLRGLTKNSGSLFLLLVLSRAFTPSLALTLALGLVPIPNTKVVRYFDKNLQQVTKLTLELFFQDQKYVQNHARATQNTGLRKQPFKACFFVTYFDD